MVIFILMAVSRASIFGTKSIQELCTGKNARQEAQFLTCLDTKPTMFLQNLNQVHHFSVTHCILGALGAEQLGSAAAGRVDALASTTDGCTASSASAPGI